VSSPQKPAILATGRIAQKKMDHAVVIATAIATQEAVVDDVYGKLRADIMQLLQTPAAQDAICFRTTGPQATLIRAIERALIECDNEFDEVLGEMERG